jgi:hypothetical protein
MYSADAEGAVNVTAASAAAAVQMLSGPPLLGVMLKARSQRLNGMIELSLPGLQQS